MCTRWRTCHKPPVNLHMLDAHAVCPVSRGGPGGLGPNSPTMHPFTFITLILQYLSQNTQIKSDPFQITVDSDVHCSLNIFVLVEKDVFSPEPLQV